MSSLSTDDINRFKEMFMMFDKVHRLFGLMFKHTFAISFYNNKNSHLGRLGWGIENCLQSNIFAANILYCLTYHFPMNAKLRKYFLPD